jgi:hypothetical protein
MNILFTQYLRPDGKRRPMYVTCPPDLEEQVVELLERGVYFDIEELRTGVVSMTAEDETVEDSGPLAHELCKNDPVAVPAAVRRLLEDAIKARKPRA